MIKALNFFFSLIVLFCGQVFAANNYISQQAYFEDETNSLSIDQIKARQFIPYEGWLAKGYSSSTYWIRLTIKPSDQELVLRIRPVYAENIQIFNSDSHDPIGLVGSIYPWGDSETPGYSHNLRLQPDKQSKELFLKVKYPRTYLLNFDVLPVKQFMSVDHIDGLYYLGYVIFAFVLALGLFGTWLINRERVLGMFTIQQFIASLHAFFIVGYARIFLDGRIDSFIVNYLSYVLVVIYPLVGVLANKLLFEEYGLKRSYRYLFNGLIGGSGIVIALLIFGFISEALRLNAQVLLLVMILLCLTAWFGVRSERDSRKINLPINALRAFYTLNLVMWSVSLLPLLGVFDAKDFAVHSYLLYSLASGLFFFLLLQYRARTIFKDELVKSTILQKEAENERSLREEQGKLMAMLTHEIRTPLSVLKLVVDRKVKGSDLEDFANRAVTNIDSIIDKCIQLDQLDVKAIKVNKTQINLFQLITAVVGDLDADKIVDIQIQHGGEIYSDYELIKTILSNLLINAMRYSPPNSQINLNLNSEISSTGQSGIQILVQNDIRTGGMPDVSQIFDKYYRGPASTRISGSGLGLFIVKELVQRLGGNVQCSMSNGSIEFTVWIPI